jgi:hypothetical protein
MSYGKYSWINALFPMAGEIQWGHWSYGFTLDWNQGSVSQLDWGEAQFFCGCRDWITIRGRKERDCRVCLRRETTWERGRNQGRETKRMKAVRLLGLKFQFHQLSSFGKVAQPPQVSFLIIKIVVTHTWAEVILFFFFTPNKIGFWVKSMTSPTIQD